MNFQHLTILNYLKKLPILNNSIKRPIQIITDPIFNMIYFKINILIDLEIKIIDFNGCKK